MGERQELPIPPAAMQADRSVEILRVWINPDKSMQTTILPTFYETAYWGVALIDLTERIAEVYAERAGLKKEDVIDSIHSVYTHFFEERYKTIMGDKAKAAAPPSKKK